MNNQEKGNKLPIEIVDLMVEDILEATDAEILQEAQEKYGDANLEAQRTKNLVEAAINDTKKSKLANARRELDADQKKSDSSNIYQLPLDAKEQIIENAQRQTDCLLAARKGEKPTENDINSALDDLIELGIIDTDGNVK